MTQQQNYKIRCKQNDAMHIINNLSIKIRPNYLDLQKGAVYRNDVNKTTHNIQIKGAIKYSVYFM